MTDKNGFTHKEAFALMWYACNCGHRERIWNSRDGVTPFGCPCPSCTRGVMQHTDFTSDTCVPDHSLRRGQRYFRDGTPDDAENIMRRRIAYMANDYPLSPEDADLLIRQVRNGETHEFQAGWPMLDVFNDA